MILVVPTDIRARHPGSSLGDGLFCPTHKHDTHTLTMRIMRIIIYVRGEGMQRTELERRLRKGGWIIESGGKHNKAYHPSNPKHKIPIPQGSQVKDTTAKRILRDAGLQ